MYQFNDEFNYKAIFWFDKILIENMNWAILPKSSKAIFPVIASHANEKGESFPSERTIAILSGVTDKAVRQGIKGLEGFPGIKWDYYLSRRGKRSKKFRIKFPNPDEKGRAFPFHQVILEYGLWRELKPSAKALYPVMRYFSYFDLDTYDLNEGGELDDPSDYNEFLEIYRDRECDYCEAEIGFMAKHAGIHRNSIKAALNNLEENFLIQPLTNNAGWKVFLRSKNNWYWKRGYLNKKIMASYRHLFLCTNFTGDNAQILPNNAQKVSDS